MKNTFFKVYLHPDNFGGVLTIITEFKHTEEGLSKAVILEIAIYQNSVISFHTASMQLDKFIMLYISNNINFCQEFPNPLA